MHERIVASRRRNTLHKVRGAQAGPMVIEVSVSIPIAVLIEQYLPIQEANLDEGALHGC
jgi:hypothetical protein